jgi:hypothetical protein
MHKIIDFPLLMSGVAVVLSAILLSITWFTNSTRPNQRVSMTLLYIGMLAMGAGRLVGVKGSNADVVLGVNFGFSASALLVALLSSRRST